MSQIMRMFDCAICSMSVEDQHAIAILACHHKFHLGCVITFVTTQDDSYCPICNQSVELSPFEEPSPIHLASKNGLRDKTPQTDKRMTGQEMHRPQSRPRKNARKQRGPQAFLQMMFDDASSVNQENETASHSITVENDQGPLQETRTTGFSQLYNKICQAEARSQYENQEAVLCYYRFGEALSRRIEEITKDGTPLQMARSKLNREVRQQLPPDISDFTLRKKIEKARKIYDIFNTLGVDKIHRIGYFTADAISRLTRNEIQYIIDVASVEYRIKIEHETINETALYSPKLQGKK